MRGEGGQRNLAEVLDFARAWSWGAAGHVPPLFSPARCVHTARTGPHVRFRGPEGVARPSAHALDHSATCLLCAPTGAWQQPVRPRDAARGKGARGVRSCGVTCAQCVLLACTAPRWARTHSGSGWHFPLCHALRCVPRSADRQPLSSLTCTTLAAAGAALHARRRGSAQRGPSAWAACAAAEAACEREARQQRPLCGQVPRRGLGGSSFASCPSAVAW